MHLNCKEEFYTKAIELNIVRLIDCVLTVLNSGRHCVHSQMFHQSNLLTQILGSKWAVVVIDL